MKSYRDGLAIRERLAKSDPGNAEWQSDLSNSFVAIGDVLAKQSNLPGALKSYRDGLEIRIRLAKSDPSNAEWQSDLADSFNKGSKIEMGSGANGRAMKQPVASDLPSHEQ